MFKFSLSKRYIPAVILLTVFIILSHVLINNVVNDNKELANIINISGKQRMLSQRLIIAGRDYYENKDKIQSFTNLLQEIKQSHEFLVTKTLLNQEIKDIYFKDKLDKHLRDYLNYFDQFLLSNDPKYLKIARAKSLSILKQLDQAVKAYEKYANNNLKETTDLEFKILIATLILLSLEVLFIFRPAAKQIDKNTLALEETNEYTKTVIESNNNAIIAIDFTGKITTYNKKAEEIFGWTKEEMIGTRNLTRIIPKKYKDKHTKASTNYLKTGISCGVLGKSHELEGLRKDGTIFPIIISFGSKYKIKGAIVVANIIDITIQKEQQNMLIQQSKLASMGEMIQNIAHQWRQPLSAISTAASGLKFEKEFGMLQDEVCYERLDSIIHTTEYLSHTIEDFSNFFKKSTIKEDFNIVEVLIQTENIVKDTYKSKGILLERNYNKEDKIICYGLANELSQVIINIFNNAKDILLEKEIEPKIVKVELREDHYDIFIKIYDNAGGIPSDILPKIFEPYFTTKHQTQGTGIGLYMSNEIIAKHFKGSLKAYNESFKIEEDEYFGACFEIIIPKSDKNT